MRRVTTALVALTAAAALVVTAAPALAQSNRGRSFKVKPTTVRAGQEVKVWGKGCKKGRRAHVKIYLGGVKIGEDKADRKGQFVGKVEIPDSADEGRHRMKASCSGRGLGSVHINVKRAHFSVSPRKVKAGHKITVSGRGCKPGSRVVIKAFGRTFRGFNANERGRFSIKIRVPVTTERGFYKVSARCGRKHLGSKTIWVKSDYPLHDGDSLNVSRNVVPAGQAITVSGDHCPSRLPVASFDGQPLAIDIDHKAKGEGFTGTATIPSTALPGKHQLDAGCDAGSAGTTELHVLEPAGGELAAARVKFGPQPPSDLAMWAGLFAGLTLLVASLGVTRRRRRS
jgi:hypothetical protein